jgi:hypothetical protein
MKSRESLESTLKTYIQVLENLDEMDTFLETYIQPKLNQEDINHLNSPVTCNEIEAVIRNLPTKKTTRPDGFTVKFYQPFFFSSLLAHVHLLNHERL